MIESTELIERWSNTKRVLAAMPEHERQHHWNMGMWGKKTDCGTIACAAGHCGLDPWFQDRGFKLTFTRGSDANISDVPSFFGIEGASRIFFNSAQRPVETVLEEVRSYVNELQKLAELESRADLPKVGEVWPSEGGIYVGARLGLNGAPNHYLIAGPAHEGHLNWADATNWAGRITVGRHSDFGLPRRYEGYLLFDRVRHLFEPAAYWLEDQYAEGSDSAWYQYFSYGSQGNYWKGSNLRARCVRRILIQ